MKRNEFFRILLLGLLLATGITFIWNYKTTLPWLESVLSSALAPVLGGIFIGFVMNLPATFLERHLKRCKNHFIKLHSRGVSLLLTMILLLLLLQELVFQP